MHAHGSDATRMATVSAEQSWHWIQCSQCPDVPVEKSTNHAYACRSHEALGHEGSCNEDSCMGTPMGAHKQHGPATVGTAQ
jgi:hypothetical protein